MFKKIFINILLIFYFVFCISSLESPGNLPIDESLYPVKVELKKAVLFIDAEGETLKIALSAKTNGWIAIGLNSLKMDKARIMIGFCENGKAFFKEQAGKGHKHYDVSESFVISYSLKEVGDYTYLILELEKDQFVKKGQMMLSFSVATGSKDNFKSYHNYREAYKLNL